MTEIWKDVNGYEGLYQVSNLGNVKSLGNNKSRKEKILKPIVQKSGHLMVQFCKEGKLKGYLIHRLVAEAFIPNPLKLPCVNHKDENPSNNSLENLEWCTVQYNTNYGTAIKRRVEKRSIAIYCIELDKVFLSSQEAYRITGVYQSNINKCLKGKINTAGGYHWKYA